MNCPGCNGEEIVRSIEQERAGYVVAILCETCNRQVCVVRDEVGDALEAAEKLFFHGKGAGG